MAVGRRRLGQAAVAGVVALVVAGLPLTVAQAAIAGGEISAAAAQSPEPYSPLTPVRICDTRSGDPSHLLGRSKQCDGRTLTSGRTLTVSVAGSFGVPAGASAVVVNVTAVVPPVAGPGYLTVFPAGSRPPQTSNLNVVAGQAVANVVQVGLGSGGAVSVFSSTGTDVVIDLEGYVAPPTAGGAGAGLYDALRAPVRICDTRQAIPPNPVPCGGHRLAAGATRSVVVAGSFAVPAGATAAIINLTAVTPSAPGYLSAFPDGSAAPAVSNVNYTAGQVIPNRVVVALGRDGDIDITTSAATDVTVDLAGYYTATGGSGAGLVTGPVPTRVCDTRVGDPSALSGPAAQCSGHPLGPSGSLTITAAGTFGVPANATAVVLNVTAIDPTERTYLAVFPGGTPPAVSDLNPAAGRTGSNLVVAAVSPAGTVSIFNDAGTTDVVVDLAGWYVPVPGAVSLSPGCLPTGIVGQAYGAALTASGGVAPYDFSVSAGSLPPGLELSSAGAISGVPTGAADSSVTVAVTDQAGAGAAQSLDLRVVADNPNSGQLSVVAGASNGGGTAALGPLNQVAVDDAGDLFIAVGGTMVRRVTPDGRVTVIAGSGQAGPPTPGPATSSPLKTATSLAVDGAGDLYIADTDNEVVEEVSPDGNLSVVAGIAGQYGDPQPGPATRSHLQEPTDVAVDRAGNLYIADRPTDAVEKVTPNGVLSVVSLAANALSPTAVAVDCAGNLYIGGFLDGDDQRPVVERATPAGDVSVVAGNGERYGLPTPGPARNSRLGTTFGLRLALDDAGDLYVADGSAQVIEEVTPAGELSIFAGVPGQGGPPTPGPATSSELSSPGGVAVHAGRLYVADGGNSVVEAVTLPTG